MRRPLIAVPVALLLSLVVAGTAFATHCGNDSKKDGAGQHLVILVNPDTGVPTILEGANAAGRFTGGYADVYIDFDLSGTISSGDGHINDTLLISEHSFKDPPGQNEEGLAVIPPILRGDNPGGDKGIGFADFTFVP